MLMTIPDKMSLNTMLFYKMSFIKISILSMTFHQDEMPLDEIYQREISTDEMSAGNNKHFFLGAN